MLKQAIVAVRPASSEYADAGPIATTQEFTAALLATRDWIGISPTQLQLATLLSFKNCAAARLQYGTLARAIAEKLGYAPPQKGKGPVRWWFALSVAATGEDDAGDGEFKWIMRPELVAALRMMKWA
jgi:hypothetical protein